MRLNMLFIGPRSGFEEEGKCLDPETTHHADRRSDGRPRLNNTRALSHEKQLSYVDDQPYWRLVRREVNRSANPDLSGYTNFRGGFREAKVGDESLGAAMKELK
jgi:hypothetical protein